MFAANAWVNHLRMTVGHLGFRVRWSGKPAIGARDVLLQEAAMSADVGCAMIFAVRTGERAWKRSADRRVRGR